MKAKLNIRSIIIAEKLLHKSFGKFDLNSESDLQVITYAMVAANNDETLTMEMFGKLNKNRKLWAEIVRQVRYEFEYMGQFNETSEDHEETDLSITDLAVSMILNGLDASFVYDMRTTDISDFLKGIEEKKREQMEQDRFWTYLKILPHVDGKKLKSPEDLITFPWEAPEKQRLKDDEFERAKANFEKFIKSK
ncbi:MAG: hypothetical protein ACYC2P_08665 [Paludibacteraceae bacterium]